MIADFIAFFTVSVIPADLKPLKIMFFSVFRCSNICTIHLPYSGFTYYSFSAISTSSGFFPSFSWFATCSANHLLYFSLIQHLAGLLTLMSKGEFICQITWHYSYSTIVTCTQISNSMFLAS